MVRQVSSVWSFFHITKVGGSENKRTACCKYCRTKYEFPNATRMTRHILEQCKSCPEDVKKSLQKKSASAGSSELIVVDHEDDDDVYDPSKVASSCSSTRTFDSASSPLSPFQSPTANPATPARPASALNSGKRQLALSSFIDNMSEDLQKKIDIALSRALYATGAPLSLFDNHYWKTAFKVLRPSYVVPSAHDLSCPLLEAEYERVMQSTEEKISQALCLSLMTDGWTNVRGDGVVNFIITTPEPIFYKSIEPGRERETAKYISDRLIEVVEKVGSRKFLTITTDNASNMRAAWVLVQAKFPHITAVGCASHSLNLLLNDLMKLQTLMDIFGKAKKIIKYVRNTHVVHATFVEKQSALYGKKARTLKLPSKTRWGAVVISFESLLENKKALIETAIEDIESFSIDKDVRRAVLDEVFWTRVQKSVNVLKPIVNSTTYLEADDALLSDVPQQFSTIEKKVIESLASSPLTSQEVKKAKEYLVKRKNFCCKAIHSAANLLDPRYRGSVLDDEQIAEAFEYITMLSTHLDLDISKVLSNIAEFRTASGFWKISSIFASAKHTTPSIWWQGLCTMQPLTPIASRLLNVPPSSAACERNWSAFGAIHTKSRNRLLSHRVEKLVAIRTNLKMWESRITTKKSRKQKVTTAVEPSNSVSDNEDDPLSVNELSYSDSEEST